MEDGVYPHLGWEFQFAVGRRCPEDFERSIASGC